MQCNEIAFFFSHANEGLQKHKAYCLTILSFLISWMLIKSSVLRKKSMSFNYYF